MLVLHRRGIRHFRRPCHLLGDRQRKELLGAQLLTVYGHVERQGEVVHVIAGRLRDDTELLGRLEVGSRDIH